MGYDDAGTGTMPLIVSYTKAVTRAAGPPTAPRGSRTVRRLPVIDGAALIAPKPKARTFWTSIAPAAATTDSTPSLRGGVAKVWLDGRVQADLEESVPQIGAPTAWERGLDGAGVTVAVLDTGIDAHHPDLAAQIDGTASFVPGEGMADVNGHGTHVASTIVGTGAASEGRYRGVAPGADLIVGKVLGGPEGSGQDSWVLAGMEWAAQSGATVVSMSLGDVAPSDGSDPMSHAVRDRRRQRRPRVDLGARRGRICTDRRRGRQAGRAGVLLQHRPADADRRTQAGHLCSRCRHHRGPLAGHDRRRDRHVPHPQRHLDGHPARVGGRGDPGPGAPRLDR